MYGLNFDTLEQRKSTYVTSWTFLQSPTFLPKYMYGNFGNHIILEMDAKL